MKIETLQDKKKVLDAVDTEIMEMIKAVREREENYEREQEEAKSRDQQLRLTRQTNRSDFNFLTMINKTTKTGIIKNKDRNRLDNRRRPNKYQHHRNQPKAQIIFE